MLKKFCVVALVLAAGFAMSGCASISIAKDADLNGQDLSSDGTTVAHINGRCFGLYFLPSIPLITGDTAAPNTLFGCAFLQDTAQLPGVAAMVTGKSKDLGGSKSLDMNSGVSSMWVYMTPFWWKSATVSANSVK